jgi:hypothetical protein
MYKMNRKQLDRIKKTFALIIQQPRTPPPAPAPALQLSLRKPRIQFLLSPVLLASVLTLYCHNAQNPTDYEITPLEHQKIISTSV